MLYMGKKKYSRVFMEILRKKCYNGVCLSVAVVRVQRCNLEENCKHARKNFS